MSLRRVNIIPFIKKLFSSYYKLSNIFAPSNMSNREFGFSFFDKPGMIRHISFTNSNNLKEYLISNVPSNVYYSSAYYMNPYANNMHEKGWLGADLIFDIDVDHIETPCKVNHDIWHCKACNHTGWGNVDKCTVCGSERVDKKTWVCETCINVARDEVLKLLDFLENDFGLSSSELLIVFSGHRGFHIHVESELVRELGQDARREIVDYVKGIGIEPLLFLEKTKGGYRYRYSIGDPGWFGRLARALLAEYPLLGGLNEEAISEVDPEDIIRSVVLPMSTWKTIFEKLVRNESVYVDEKVTIDIKRLIRLPESLHGKTGLKAVKLSAYELENKDIIEKAKVFREGYVRLYVENIPRIILDEKIDISKGIIDVPMYLGIYILLNGRAELIKVY